MEPPAKRQAVATEVFKVFAGNWTDGRQDGGTVQILPTSDPKEVVAHWSGCKWAKAATCWEDPGGALFIKLNHNSMWGEYYTTNPPEIRWSGKAKTIWTKF